MNVSEIFAGISTLEKVMPVVEHVGKEIGPLVQSELADGKQLWADVEKCWTDFKTAVAAVKTVAPLETPQP